MVSSLYEKIFKMKLFKANLNLFYDVVFSILVFSIPLSVAIPNICLAILPILFFLSKRKINFQSYVLKATVFFILFFIIKALITQSFISDIFFYKKLLLILVLVFLVQKIENKRLVKTSFITGTILAIFLTLYKTTNYYFQYHELPLGDTIQSIKLLLIHRPYFGFICVLVIISLLQIRTKLLNKKIYIDISILFVVSFIVFISARLSILLTLLIFIIIILKNKQISYKRTVLYLLLIFISSVVLIFANNNLKQRLHIQDTYNKTIKELSNYEPRFIIWECSFDLLKQKKHNYLFGFSDKHSVSNYLVNCYSEKIKNESKKEYYIKEKFNSHNQFIDFLLNDGVVGLLVFLIFFVYLFYNSRFNIYLLLIILSFFIFSLVENIFWRQLGVYLFGFLIPIFESNFIKNSEKTI